MTGTRPSVSTEERGSGRMGIGELEHGIEYQTHDYIYHNYG